MMIQRDFHRFNPRAYLQEYYRHLGKENRALLNFQIQAYQQIFTQIDKARVLEFGGGPTIYQLINAANYPLTIDFCDYLQANLNEVEKWLKNRAGKFNWNVFIQYVLKKEGEQSNAYEIKKRAQLIRHKVKRLFSCDIREHRPLSIIPQPHYQVVSVNFVPESITTSLKEWSCFINRLVSLIKPKGYLLMTAIIGAKYYRVGRSYFPAVPVSSAIIKRKLKQKKLSVILTDFVNAENQVEQGYEGILMILGRKN